MSFDVFNPEHPVNPVKKISLKDINCYKYSLLKRSYNKINDK